MKYASRRWQGCVFWSAFVVTVFGFAVWLRIPELWDYLKILTPIAVAAWGWWAKLDTQEKMNGGTK